MSEKKREGIVIINRTKRFSYTLGICLVIFVLAISLLIVSFNKLISSHDESLSGEICTLITEKMNNSIYNFTVTTESVASVLTAQNFHSLDEIYETLKDDDSLVFSSIGFIDENGKIFGSKAEKAEFDKWNLLDIAAKADPVSISIPYRTAASGHPIITMFTKFQYDDGKDGYLFVSYKFEIFQNIANTNTDISNFEIDLMNADSANIIPCVSDDATEVGAWTNAYLVMENIDSYEGQTKYMEFIDQLNEGKASFGVRYPMNDTLYSQYCSKIESMPGWYVVVRMPSDTLSVTLNTFRNNVLVFIALLLILVVVLFFNMYITGRMETDVLTELSIQDPLTQLLNRRGFENRVKEYMISGEKLALIFFDIDLFKQINDRYGHDIGDIILGEFAVVLNKNFGETSLISRFGGDEFVLLSKMRSKDEIDAKLEATINDVLSIIIPGSDMHLSVSAGIAQYPADSEDLDLLKKCADEALYKSKKSGRNCYNWYEEEYCE